MYVFRYICLIYLYLCHLWTFLLVSIMYCNVDKLDISLKDDKYLITTE